METDFIVHNNVRFHFSCFKKDYAYTPYSNYNIHIQAYDMGTNVLLFDISLNEQRFFQLLSDLFEYDYQYGYILDNYIHLGADEKGDEFIVYVSNVNQEHPMEEDYCTFMIIKDNIYNGNNAIRYSDTWDFYILEDFIMAGWKVIEDIPYVMDLGSTLYNHTLKDVLFDEGYGA